ncbi:hypothetical protein BJV77DRAFT_63730 [Russula vinacea]|nr:hypothetical protein BJV77DRAFT_63730 [Russula vinacea]
MRLSQSPPFFTPLSYRSRQAAPLQCKLAVLASRTTRDQRGRRSRCCISSVLTHAPARRHSFLDRVWSSATTCTNVHRAWSAIAVVTPHDTLCVRCHNEDVEHRHNATTHLSWRDHARTLRHHQRHHSD